MSKSPIGVQDYWKREEFQKAIRELVFDFFSSERPTYFRNDLQNDFNLNIVVTTKQLDEQSEKIVKTVQIAAFSNTRTANQANKGTN